MLNLKNRTKGDKITFYVVFAILALSFGCVAYAVIKSYVG